MELLSDVKILSDFIINNHKKLDMLINNAGNTGSPKKCVTKDGFESILQANYLSPVYLTHLLYPLLKNTKESRIINISSHAHINNPFGIHMPFNNKLGIGYEPNFPFIHNDMNWEKRTYSSFQAYSDSKLYFTMFTGLVKGVKCVAVHPGVVRTSMVDNFGKNNLPFFSVIK